MYRRIFFQINIYNLIQDDKYYELPTADELASIELTEEKVKDIQQR